MKPVSLAIVGCGDLTRRTILPHLALPDAQKIARVVAVCDLNRELAARTAREFGIATHFADFSAMLAQSEAEAVLVVVPPQFHGVMAIAVAQSGRHVYIQKPLAPTIAECDAVLDAAKEANVHLVCAPHLELWPLYAQIRARIQSGEFGPIYNAKGPLLGWGGFDLRHGSDPKWCFSRGSGPLRDHGVYGLTALVSMLGNVRKVGALGNIASPKRAWNGAEFGVEELDNLALTLEFRIGALGILAESWCATTNEAGAFRLHALEAVIEGGARFAGYHGLFPLEAKISRMNRETEIWSVNPDEIGFLDGEHRTLWNPHIWADIRHLCQAICGETALIPSGQTARHIVQIIEAAHESARENRFVELR